MNKSTLVEGGFSALIAGGETIKVTSIQVAAGTAASVDIFERDGTTLIMRLAVSGGFPSGYARGFEFTTEFIAERGIFIDNTVVGLVANNGVTIFYSQGGV